jgi:imidazole glycerol-phosphate synthase subunit HisF
MLQARIIPVLLLQNRGLVKTVKFDKPKYIGDPINAVRIFNEKEVDELILLDIDASKHQKEPDYELIQEIGSEAFIPFAYGGGITSAHQAKKILFAGAEKVIINSNNFNNENLISEVASLVGASSTVAAIDIKKNFWGKYRVYIHSKNRLSDIDPFEFCQRLESLGAGELFINSVDLDGTMTGYDIGLIERITSSINIPVVACGGAGTIKHLKDVIHISQASAAAAGSMFVFHGKHKAVLINYPEREQLSYLRTR